MNQDTENFEQLRRLLALKRHEQPPPGYFNHFSNQVIARIKAGERGGQSDFLERLLWEAPWLRHIWAALEAKPILAGVFGVAVCGLLITGVVYSDRPDSSSVSLLPAPEETAPLAIADSSAVNHPLLGQPAPFVSPGTNPLATAQMEGSLLGDIGKLRAQSAAFSFPGGN